jgi:hypothetical protein
MVRFILSYLWQADLFSDNTQEELRSDQNHANRK